MMKKVTLIILLLVSTICNAQILQVDTMTYQQVEDINSQYYDYNPKICKTVGYALFAIGAVGTLGSVLTWQCNKDAMGRTPEETENCRKMSEDGKYAAYVFIPVMVVGIPLAIVGSKKSKK